MPDAKATFLEERASQIPSMGARALGDRLRRAATEVQEGQSIVEVACWLGSGTAHLALGIRDSGKSIDLHCYDLWQSNATEVEKARKKGLTLDVGQDTLPWVKSALEPFEVPISFHKGRIENGQWPGGEIALFVADAAKRGHAFRHMMETFGPWFVPGRTVLFMMDLHYYEKAAETYPDDQHRFFKDNPDCFEVIEDKVGSSSCSILRYTKRLNFHNAIRKTFLEESRNFKKGKSQIKNSILLRNIRKSLKKYTKM
ncbi:MAG: hypothetical protein ACQETX_15160 [Pseudomonadota bacterium]